MIHHFGCVVLCILLFTHNGNAYGSIATEVLYVRIGRCSPLTKANEMSEETSDAQKSNFHTSTFSSSRFHRQYKHFLHIDKINKIKTLKLAYV